MRTRRAVWTVTVLLAAAAAWAEEQVVTSFETQQDVAEWNISSGGTRLVTEGVTHGKQALELTFDPNGRWSAASLQWARPMKDWSAWDVLAIDVTNPNDRPIRGGCLVGDEAWNAKATYWNRHNGGTVLAPGKNRWLIPVHGLWRGEAGSKNNDIKTDIDPTRITRLDLSFGGRGDTGRIIVDHIRFIRTERPKNLWAFDFGPPSQAVMPGWTPVSNRTRYDDATGFGWNGQLWDGAARTTTFGPMLTEDFTECSGQVFRVKAPAGDYEVFLLWELSGYWGGEQAKHKHREITVDGRVAWSEDRPLGSATALYQFEDVEPVGVDIWKTYMADHLMKPIRFRARAAGNGLSLRFESDAGWSCHVSAMVVYRADDAGAKQWVDAQMKAVQEEFRSKAVPLDPPARTFTPSAAWRGKALVAWPMDVEDAVHPNALPPKDIPAPDALRLTAEAVRGEYEPLCIAVMPTRELKGCKVELEWALGGKVLPHTVHRVRYNTSRGFGQIAYYIKPYDLREFDTVDLPANVTRQFIATVKVPEDAAPGTYGARLRIIDAAGNALLTVPVAVNVHDVTLSRETDYLMSFFGLNPNRALVGDEKYDDTLEQTLAMLREHGMNALTVTPWMELTGWKDGEPQIDFRDCDEVFALYRRHGFTKPIGLYGTFIKGLSGGYVKGAEGEKVERESGLDYPEALMRAWGAVDKHARAKDWPLVYMCLCDETRVRDRAENELAFMKMMGAVSKRYPATVRTSGAYSVDFNTRPTDMNDLKYWHQRFFEALDVNSLNNHDDLVMAETKRLGKEIHIYNQGQSRYSFGLYQWSEFTKGVTARWQWHLTILHGYQFFDLDGREPDPAMIVYTSKGIRPTIMFERCREGAEDFYLYQTLAHLIDANRKAGRKVAETNAADAMFRALTADIKINQRRPPEGYDPHRIKLDVIAAIKRIQ